MADGDWAALTVDYLRRREVWLKKWAAQDSNL